MVSAVIHGGCYKTATSTIQAVAQKNRERFLGTFGVLYPKTGTRANQGVPDPDSVAHHLLFHAARTAAEQTGAEPKSSFDNLRAKLAAEIQKSGARRVFVSTELLSFASETVKAHFLRYFNRPSDEVAIVYGIRRPDEMIDSMNNQMLRAGRGRIRSRDLVDYKTDIEQWAGLVGPDRVRVLYFTKQRYDAYIRAVFAEAGVDVTSDGVETDAYANAPMSVSGHVIRAMIYDRLKARGIEIDRTLRHEINLALAPIEEKLSPSPKVVTLGPDDRTRILQANEDELEAVKAWLTPEDRMALEEDVRRGFAGPHPEPNLNAPASLGKDDLAVLLQGLIASPALRKLLAIA